MADAAREPRLYNLQVSGSSPLAKGLARATNPVLPPLSLSTRLAHFAEEVFDISPETHLARFMKALLGEGGAGYIRKRLLLTRLAESLSGANFFDIDRFYGALFAVGRRSNESIEFDPFTEYASVEDWERVLAADAAYRSRVEQFAKAIQGGATPPGIESMAEALLGVDVDLSEGYIRADQVIVTYQDLEDTYNPGGYGNMDTLLYDTLEGGAGTLSSQDRWHFTITPKRPITFEEQYDLVRALMRFKPAHATFDIQTNGPDIFERVAIRAAWSHSNFWEIRRRVLPIEGKHTVYGAEVPDVLVEPTVAPFTQYQGEAWSLLPLVSGINSYTLASIITPISLVNPDESLEGAIIGKTGLVERINFRDGSYIDYRESFALRRAQEVLAGRAISDGIAVSHPFMSRTDFGVGETADGTPVSPTLPELRVDRVPITEIPSTTSDPSALRQQFWSTEPAAQNIPTPEVLEIRLRSAQYLNYCSFEVPKFPHTGVVQYQSPDTGVWTALHIYSIRESFPARLGSRVDSTDSRHPQHNIAGHWTPIKVPFNVPVNASRLRVILQRSTDGTPPRNDQGQSVPYSLGIKGLDLGFRVYEESGLPQLPQQPENGWGVTEDLLGSRVYLDTRRRDAVNVITGTDTPWWCEPMPIPSAVVPMYLDVRDAKGQGQVIDRFWIDPLTEGVPFNLYWSDGEPDYSTAFEAGDNNITPTLDGPIVIDGKGAWIEAGSSITVPAEQVLVDFDQSWWLGVIFNPLYSSALEDHEIWSAVNDDTGWTMNLRASGGSVTVSLTDPLRWGATPQEWTMDCGWQDNEQVSLAVSWNATTQVFTIHCKRTSSGADATDFPVGFPLNGRPDRLIFGASNVTWHGYIKAIILKQGVSLASYSTEAEQWWRQGTDYLLPVTWKKEDDGHLNNTIFRFHPAFWGTGLTGFRGLAASWMENLSWKRVPRTYRLNRGYIHLPALRAKFFKFEFSGLFPRWYEPFVPLRRRVKLFPKNMLQHLNYTSGASELLPGMSTLTNKAFEYVDRPADTSLQIAGQATPTEMVYAPDPLAARNMRDVAWFYNSHDWHFPETIPSWSSEGAHRYEEVILNHDSKIAYWVGVREIQAWRTVPTQQADTSVYRDLLHDTSLFDSSTFSADPGYIWSTINGAIATSKVMASLHNVQGVQFATQQTPAVQLIPNDDFRDPATQRDSQPRQATFRVDSSYIITVWGVSLAEAEAAAHRFDPEDYWTSTDNLDGSISMEWTLSTADEIPWGYYYYIRRNPLSWHAYGDAALDHDLQHAVMRVSRNRAADVAFRGVPEGIMRPPGDPIMSFRDGGFGPKNIDYGGIESPFVAVSKRGMISAAVRLRATKALTSPLYLQIIAADDTTVIAQKEIVLPGDRVVEATVNYHIGDNYADGALPTFDPRTILDDPLHPIFAGMDPLVDLGETWHAMKVRLYQDGVSQDIWEVDRLSLFDESILWEFSVDGGTTWQESIGEIRNNPNGLIRFPTRGNSLRWRATAWRRNLAISSIQVRPWYEGNLNVRQILPQRGGNVSTFDQDPPIDEDPEFQRWHHITPHWWFLEGQRFPDAPMPLEDQPVITEYARHFARTIDEDISGLTADAVRESTLDRTVEESVYGTAEDIDLGGSTYNRGVAETVTPTEDVGHNVIPPGGIMGPPDDFLI